MKQYKVLSIAKLRNIIKKIVKFVSVFNGYHLISTDHGSIPRKISVAKNE